MSIVQDFLTHEQAFNAITTQRAELETAKRVASDTENWNQYDTLESQIDQTFDDASVHNMAMSDLVGKMTADDKAELRTLRAN